MKPREQILDSIRSLPTLPIAALRVLQLIESSQGQDLKEVTKSIEIDPGLTANVLRMANSPAFSGVRTISSIREAVIRLGMDTMRRLICTAVIGPMAWKSVKGYDLPSGALWEHMAAVSVGATHLARQLKVTPPDSLFTAGILHDIGKVAMGAFVDFDVAPILTLVEHHKYTFVEAEMEVLGIDHAEAGAILLEVWNLPAVLVDAARWHHAPNDPRYTPSLIVDLIHTTDALALLTGFGSGGRDGLNYRCDEAVAARLHMKNSIGEMVICHMIDEVEVLKHLVFGESSK